MNDVDPQLFDQVADDPSLRLLSGQMNQRPGGRIGQAPREIVSQPEQDFVEPTIFYKIQAAEIFGESFGQLGAIACMNNKPCLDLSPSQEPEVIERNKGFPAESGGCIVCDQNDAH
jgi:hypothetical protein